MGDFLEVVNLGPNSKGESALKEDFLEFNAQSPLGILLDADSDPASLRSLRSWISNKLPCGASAAGSRAAF